MRRLTITRIFTIKAFAHQGQPRQRLNDLVSEFSSSAEPNAPTPIATRSREFVAAVRAICASVPPSTIVSMKIAFEMTRDCNFSHNSATLLGLPDKQITGHQDKLG